MAENTDTNHHDNVDFLVWLWPLRWHMPYHTHTILHNPTGAHL